MSSPRLPIAAALLLAALALPAAAQDLASGRYSCAIGGQGLGSVEIDGTRYRAGSGEWRGFRRVGPAIMWDGPLGQISAAGEIVGSTLAGGSGFDVQIKAKDGGAFKVVSCRA